MPLSKPEWTSRHSSAFVLKRSFKFAAALFLGFELIALSGCNQYSENGLVGDYVSASKCPANGCADQAPDPNYISLKTNLPTLQMGTNDARVDISGDCFPSTYPQNVINITVTRQGAGTIPLAASSPDAAVPTPMCRKGHFDIVLDGAGIASGGTYLVRLELVAIDKDGGRHTNNAGGVISVSVHRN